MFGGKGKSLEDQLKEQKEKEKKILKQIDEEREQKRKAKELKIQIAQEKEILENKKAEEDLIKKESKRINDLKHEQEKYAKNQAKKEQVKEHPDGCFCEKCAEIRKDKEPEIKKLVEESKPETGYLGEPKKSKFSFKLPKRTPKPEVLKKDDLDEYHKVKKDPTKLVSFIKNQREKLSKNKQDEAINSTILSHVNPDAIDTKIQPTIFTDITVLGLRLAVGFSFIAHGLSKMDGDGQMFMGMLQSWGVPIELTFPIALLELLAGIFLTLGFLTRISSAFIGVIMLGAIFVVKGPSALIGQGGIELDLIILATVALLGMFGPGRFSIANIGIKGMIFDRKLQ